jgi:hypothetical protein
VAVGKKQFKYRLEKKLQSDPSLNLGLFCYNLKPALIYYGADPCRMESDGRRNLTSLDSI